MLGNSGKENLTEEASAILRDQLQEAELEELWLEGPVIAAEESPE